MSDFLNWAMPQLQGQAGQGGPLSGIAQRMSDRFSASPLASHFTAQGGASTQSASPSMPSQQLPALGVSGSANQPQTNLFPWTSSPNAGRGSASGSSLSLASGPVAQAMGAALSQRLSRGASPGLSVSGGSSTPNSFGGAG